MSSNRSDSGKQRLHHLDAIRVSAILLLIPYHAARYLQKGLPENKVVDAAIWFVHTWHMPLFFAISGFLAAGALRRSTAAGHVRARLRRLGLPLFIGMLTVVPLANFLVIEAAAIWPRDQKIPAKRELTFGHVFNLTPQHLWFIAYLLVVSLLAVGVWLAVKRAPAIAAAVNRGFRALMGAWWGIPALASLSALILITKHGWVAGGTMSDSLVPVPALLAYFGFFFAFGWLLSGQEDLIEGLKQEHGDGWCWARRSRSRPSSSSTRAPISPATSAAPGPWWRTARSGSWVSSWSDLSAG